jgi:hypothetical protein
VSLLNVDSFESLLLQRFQAAVMASAQEIACKIRDKAVNEFDDELRRLMATTIASEISDHYSFEQDKRTGDLRVTVTFKHKPRDDE